MEKKEYDIAVVGESMVGKSTWIANLFTKENTEKLKSICQYNSEGQTKIATYYKVEMDIEKKLELTSIGWNIDDLFDEHNEKSNQETIKKISDFFGMQEDIDFYKYFKSEEFKMALKRVDPISVIKEIVNNEEICNSGLISYIEITGGASEEVANLMRQYNLETLCIRDTRGFLDETTDKMNNYLNEINEKSKIKKDYENPEFSSSLNEEEYIQKLMDDRGIYGIDACVFMSMENSISLNKKNIKGIYGPLIRMLLVKYPTFLVVRSSDFTKKMSKAEEKKYLDCCNEILNDDFFSGFDNIRELLSEFGLYSHSSDYKTEIAHKHYKELLLAGVSKKRLNKDGEIYRKSVVGVLSEVIKGVRDYYKDISEAEEFIHSINKIDGSHLKKMKEIFDEYFERDIKQNSILTENEYFMGLYKYSLYFLAEKIKECYYGGFVGERGGLSTQILGGGHVGDAAIDIMEAAYKIKQYIYEEIINCIALDIEGYCKTTLKDEEDIKSAVSNMKQKIYEKYQYDLDNNFERLSITKRMVPRCYLEKAHMNTHKELEIKEGRIGSYLKELENTFEEKKLENEKYIISVVKYITWQLIELSSKALSANGDLYE